jgi:hypothetical protein
MTRPGEVPIASDKVQYFKELANERLSGAGSGFGSGDALGVEISIQSVDRGIEYQMAIGAVFQVALDLALDRSRKATF